MEIQYTCIYVYVCVYVHVCVCVCVYHVYIYIYICVCVCVCVCVCLSVQFDLGMVYDEPEKCFIHKWLLLTDPDDPSSGTKVRAVVWLNNC